MISVLPNVVSSMRNHNLCLVPVFTETLGKITPPSSMLACNMYEDVDLAMIFEYVNPARL